MSAPKAASPSIDNASASIIEPFRSRRAEDFDKFTYAPETNPERKRNVYIILDAGDAAMVASFVALGAVLIGIGLFAARGVWGGPWFDAKKLANGPVVERVDEALPIAANAVAWTGEHRVELSGGSCRVVEEAKLSGRKADQGLALEVVVDYRMGEGDALGGDGMTALVVRGDQSEGRWEVDKLTPPQGKLPLAFKLANTSRESLKVLKLHLEGPGEEKLSNELELTIGDVQSP